MKWINTVIVGGGQAGLACSYYLTQHQIDHVIFEQAMQPASAWREQRWDTFTLVTPNWAFLLPGASYDGPDPNGYMRREEVISRLEHYIDRYALPIQYGIKVLSVNRSDDDTSYMILTNQEVWHAKNLVIATGLFQKPKLPSFYQQISPRLVQLHSCEYHNPAQLPLGAVLVVGSAQSGAQIAEELLESGRKVYLAVSHAGRVPRRYRGQDIVYWLDQIGFFDRTAAMLASPKLKFAGNPQVTGKNGGHTINLNALAGKGLRLYGHLMDAKGERIVFADDLKLSLENTDKGEADILKKIDGYIETCELKLQKEIIPELKDGYEQTNPLELNLSDEGISTIIWATGFAFDFSFIHLPIRDADGFPITRKGVSEFPGLYFVGMPFINTMKSGLLMGIGADAKYITSLIALSELSSTVI